MALNSVEANIIIKKMISQLKEQNALKVDINKFNPQSSTVLIKREGLAPARR